MSLKSLATDRVYRMKRPVMNFFCPLCRAERSLIYRSKLTKKNYVQVLAISSMVMLIFFPIMEWRIFIFPLIVWGAFEACNKMLFRKDIPCPYCGFDATWYKKDVRVAKRMVVDFWKRKNEVKETQTFSETKKEDSGQAKT